jgi:glucose-6-phosphate-specific signal transduction histidine kinase
MVCAAARLGTCEEWLLAQASERHFGLRGMRERATLIGGKLTMWSELDAGTEVELRLPASTAYGTAPRSS